MALTPEDIRRVLEALDASDWDEATITVGDVRIAVARNGARLPEDSPAFPTTAATAAPVSTEAPAPEAAAPAPAPSVTPAAAESADDETSSTTIVVTSPTVGVFWRSAEPGAPAFVEEGQHVSAGDTLCIVEVMKLMSHVIAPANGTVTAIHVANATSVEHGAALFTLTLDEG